MIEKLLEKIGLAKRPSEEEVVGRQREKINKALMEEYKKAIKEIITLFKEIHLTFAGKGTGKRKGYSNDIYDEIRQKLQLLPDEIDLIKNKKYRKAVKNLFFFYLRHGHVDSAIKTQEELGYGINFSDDPNYKKEVKSGFFASLGYGSKDNAYKIREIFGQGIDFADEPDYEKRIQEAFQARLWLRGISEALRLQKEFGQGIDFTEQAKAEFFRGFKKRPREEEMDRDNTFKALAIQRVFDLDIDFTKIKGFKNTLKNSFFRCLNIGEVRQLQEFYIFSQKFNLAQLEGYEREVSLSFIRRLKEREVEEAFKIYDCFGKGIDFTKIEDYEDTVITSIASCLRNHYFQNAIRLNDTFGESVDVPEAIAQAFEWYLDRKDEEGIVWLKENLSHFRHFESKKTYHWMLGVICHKRYPEFRDYLSNKLDEDRQKEFIQKLKNIFR